MDTKPYLEALKTCLQAYACNPYNLYGDQALERFNKSLYFVMLEALFLSSRSLVEGDLLSLSQSGGVFKNFCPPDAACLTILSRLRDDFWTEG